MTARTSILLVDDDAVSRQLLAQTLETAGYTCTALDHPSLAFEGLARGSFALLLVASTLAEGDPENLLAQVCSSAPARVRVVLLLPVGCEAEIARGFALGADDCLRKSAAHDELLCRVAAQLQLRDCALQLAQHQAEQQTLRDLTEQLASSVDVRHILLTVVQQTAALVRVDRCSIVLFGDEGQMGYVLASSDDAGLTELPIDLAAYPEIVEVMTTGRTLAMADATQRPLMYAALTQQAARQFQSRVVVPLAHDHGAIGVLFLRTVAPRVFSDMQLSLLGIIANATAIALRNARILQRLRTETELSTTARVEAERRVRLFRRYADFFESAADGMVVIDRCGNVLFANPRALEITGFAQSELLGVPFQLFLHPTEHERAAQVLRGFDAGVYPRGTDFSLQSRSGRRVVVNVSFSAVLHEDNAVLFSFRDVTSERRTAVELTQTKEFLECVIDSSVDGIVSADLRGTVLLLNRAAARIFGYVPANVIGKMNVDKLYPP
ncbi:MAG TPA: PAS domain S-box protein, partial [Polyangiaceae bacterium]|nr:PAS domain S-box protein [Polyangiaceae bacterium]